MNEKEFLNNYWSQYILLEKEFLSIISYVFLDENNFNVFSNSFIKIILEI